MRRAALALLGSRALSDQTWQGTFGRFTAQLEAKWFGVGEDLRSTVVEWLSPNDIGTFGVQVGVGYRFDVNHVGTTSASSAIGTTSTFRCRRYRVGPG